ncbi:GEVED domain-containing protein [Flavobacterium sp.]|uniref:GEVED domain-containing protein n=1 Tax=Flavobacterium sp. TaxID=239 RepID=UPI0038FCE80D
MKTKFLLFLSLFIISFQIKAQYCTPNPTSVDGTGITNVTMGTINNTTVAETDNYGDYSSQITDVNQGLQTSFSISYDTGAGYTYETKIWIDWNNDFDFDDTDEEVYSGTTDGNSLTTLSGFFAVPASAVLGNHRLRVGGQDNGPVTPCYNDSYGTFEDYTINVVIPTCAPPAATTSVTPNCTSSQYFVEVNVTNLGSGTPSITDGTTTWPVTATGNVQVGPFAFNTPTTLTLQHGNNATCNVIMGTYNYVACPPANDDCANAILLTVGTTYNDYITDGTNLEASDSTETITTCNGLSGGDIWYKVIVPASGSITIETGDTTTAQTGFDSVIAIYSGACGSLTHIDCDDDSGPSSYSLKSVTNQTPGATLYIRVFEYANDVLGDIGISAYDVPLSTTSFDNTNFSAYPNPVKDVLNLSYTSNISKVAICNLLGQEMFKKDINASQSQIDISSLTNGAYFVKVEVDNLVKTIKIIKTN